MDRIAAQYGMFARSDPEKYTDIKDLIEDCRQGKTVYLRDYPTAPYVVMQCTVTAVLGMIERGQLRRVRE